VIVNGGTLPILNAGLPIWYHGKLAAVAVDGEVYSVGWVEPGDRSVLRAMALASFDAPHFTSDQQFSFAAYYLLPEDLWCDLQALPDELIARHAELPVDLVRRRRILPSVEPRACPECPVSACA